MDSASFDAMTQQSAGSSSRLISLFALGKAEVRAAVASMQRVEAKKKHGKKKHKNKQNLTQPAPQECPPLPVDLCPSEVQPCVDIFTAICAGDPSCQDSIACCSHFATCDVGGFFNCLLVSEQN